MSQDRLSSVLKWTWLGPAFASNLISTAFIDPFSCFWKHTHLFLVWSLLTIHFTLPGMFLPLVISFSAFISKLKYYPRETNPYCLKYDLHLPVDSLFFVNLFKKVFKIYLLLFIFYYLSLPVDSKIYKHKDCASDLPFYPQRFALSQAYGKL